MGMGIHVTMPAPPGAPVGLPDRRIRGDLHPEPRAELRIIVPDSKVLDAAIVPEGDDILCPMESHRPFRPLAMAEEELEQRIGEKDTLLRELQHRVKNNLQMITALIRLEARNVSDVADGARFDRLAGRVESLALLYRALSDENQSEEVDLGVYLSQVASAVMKAHAIEGIRLELKVDTWPVSVNVAMPAGLVVNELMTNALKHAFEGRDGGTIKLHSLVDDIGCKVIVADDGVGLPLGEEWPQRGKLSALIVKSLQENARAQLDVTSILGVGTTVTIRFTRAAATGD